MTGTTLKIPFLDFSAMNAVFRDQAIAGFTDFFDSKWYVLGESVARFESEYADFNQVKHAIGTSNGLDALHLCLRALNVGSGDEVIVPSNTFIATVLAVLYTGATPVFVEPRRDTYNINPANIEAAITCRTKVIMPVHLYGQACEMEEIIRIAERHKIHVVEDNAQSQGATYGGKLTGSFGIANATSFYPGKNLGALGDAGAVTTNDSAMAKSICQLRNYGSSKKYHNEVVGYNNRIDEVQAMLLNLKLPHLADWNTQRQSIASQYDDVLSSVSEVMLPTMADGATSVFHLYVIRTEKRDELKEYLTENGVATLIHYPIPPHLQIALKSLGFTKGDFPVAEELAETSLSLPLYPGLSEKEVSYVCTAIKNYFYGE